MRIVVTGATGFLGMRTAFLLQERGYTVVGIGRNKEKGNKLTQQNIGFFQGDLTNYNQVQNVFESADVVVHCAALSSPWGKYESFYKANVTATQHVVQACLKHEVSRLIHISTPSLYFNHNERTNVKEEDKLPRQFVNHYAETKWLAEQVVQNAVAKGLFSILLRPRAIFGPGDTTLLPRLIRANTKSGIPHFKGKDVLTDLTYVDNVVDAIELTIHAPASCNGHVYNITNGEPIVMHDVLQQLFQSINSPMKVLSLPYQFIFGVSRILEWFYCLQPDKEPPLTRYAVSVLGKSQTLNIEKAKSMFGYNPRITTEEGVKRFATWYMHHSN